MIKLFIREIKQLKIIWFYIAIILLYGFSTRMPLVTYVLPLSLFFYYFATRFNEIAKLKKEFLTYYLLLGMFALLYIIGGMIYIDYQYRIRIGVYILFFFLPLSIVFYNEFCKLSINDSTFKLFFVFLTLGLTVFFMHKYGVISKNRYQQVGNILAATSILTFQIYSKYTKRILFAFLLFLIIIVGSRQSLISVIFAGVMYFFIKNLKTFLVFLLTSIIVLFNKSFLLEKATEFAFKYKYETLKRLTYALNSDSVLGKRADIYYSLISEVKLYPNFKFSPNQDHLLPHNFFLEYFIICGFVIGVFFLLFMLIILNRSIKNMKNQTLFYFVMIFFIPFNLSSGFSAAKYFVFFVPAIIYWSGFGISKKDIVIQE